jgi:serine/threonine-protein kinase RsbW
MRSRASLPEPAGPGAARQRVVCNTSHQDLVHATNNSAGAPQNAETGQLDLVNNRAEIDAFVSQLLGFLSGRQYPEPSRFAVRLAFEEAISNAFRHGHRDLPGDTPVQVTYSIGHDELTIAVADQGPGFDPSAVPDPTLDENLELPSGRGLMLMRAYMTSVAFERENGSRGNRVQLHYRRPAPRRSPPTPTPTPTPSPSVATDPPL